MARLRAFSSYARCPARGMDKAIILMPPGDEVTISSDDSGEGTRVTTASNTYGTFVINDLSTYPRLPLSAELIDSIEEFNRIYGQPREFEELKEYPEWVEKMRSKPQINIMPAKLRNLVIFKGK